MAVVAFPDATFIYLRRLTALTAPRSGEGALPLIPVNVRLPGVDEDVNSEDLAAILIKRTSRIFVEGAPGSGKTTLTRRVTLNLIAAKITHCMNRRPPRTCVRDFH